MLRTPGFHFLGKVWRDGGAGQHNGTGRHQRHDACFAKQNRLCLRGI